MKLDELMATLRRFCFNASSKNETNELLSKDVLVFTPVFEKYKA